MKEKNPELIRVTFKCQQGRNTIDVFCKRNGKRTYIGAINSNFEFNECEKHGEVSLEEKYYIDKHIEDLKLIAEMKTVESLPEILDGAKKFFGKVGTAPKIDYFDSDNFHRSLREFLVHLHETDNEDDLFNGVTTKEFYWPKQKKYLVTIHVRPEVED